MLTLLRVALFFYPAANAVPCSRRPTTLSYREMLRLGRPQTVLKEPFYRGAKSKVLLAGKVRATARTLWPLYCCRSHLVDGFCVDCPQKVVVGRKRREQQRLYHCAS